MSIDASPDLRPSLTPRSHSGDSLVLVRPTPRRRPEPSRIDLILGQVVHSPSLWVLPVLLVQSLAIWRYAAVATPSTTAAVATGHLMLAHLLHGAASTGASGSALGIAAVYAVPAALLADLGGMPLVHLANACLELVATWFTYRATRHLFGQGAALIAATVLALNVDALVDARLGGGAAISMALLAAGLWLAASAGGRRARLVTLGPVLALAIAACYSAAPLAVAALVLTATAPTAARQTTSRLRSGATATASTLLSAVVLLLVSSGADRSGLRAAARHHALSPAAQHAVSRQLAVDIVPLLLAAAIGVGIAVARRRWASVVTLVAAGAATVVAVTALGTPSPPQSGLALATVVLAPVVGLAGISLLGRGRLLGLRAPLTVIALALFIGQGMAGSNQLLHQHVTAAGWGVSSSVGAAP